MSGWINIATRLPTAEDADERGQVAWKWKDGTIATGRFNDLSGNDDPTDPVVAWLPLPRYTPPAPGPTDEECDEIIWRNFDAYATDGARREVLRDWFATVTARIQREAGG